MPRDYAKNQHKERRPLPGWLWMLAGLIIGLFISLLMYIRENSSGQAVLPETVTKIFQPREEAPVAKPEKSQAPPPQTQADTPSKPRFDFYTILPELEVAIPEQELQEKKPATPSAPAETTQQSYMLQAGSFRELTAADRLKARLALEGIEARIQVIQNNDGDTWHRVRIGPLSDLKLLNQTRQRLSRLGIASIVVRDKK